MISILLITLPTLLMGCLPTYAHIGLAAPALMAILRFVQGIAVGGEVSRATLDVDEYTSPQLILPALVA
jgi:MFS family permease